MTIPGMGHILAMTVKAEIVDIGRFATPEKLVSYAGLAPSRHDSGERTRTGGITKRGSVGCGPPWLRARSWPSGTTPVSRPSTSASPNAADP